MQVLASSRLNNRGEKVFLYDYSDLEEEEKQYIGIARLFI